MLALQGIVRASYEALEALVSEYAGHAALHAENETFDARSLRGRPLEALRSAMGRYAAQMELFDAMPPAVAVGIFCADAAALRARFAPSPKRALGEVRAPSCRTRACARA